MKNLLACAMIVLVMSLAARAADDGKVVLFNGKNLDGWKLRNEKLADTWIAAGDVQLDPSNAGNLLPVKEGPGALLRRKIEHGSDLVSEKTFGDCELHIEFMVPKGSNSGVYLMGQYEVQVLDSFGKPDDKLGQGDVGAIYSAAAPLTNASTAPGTWQTFDIVFKAPRFDAAGKKTDNAVFVLIKLNGKTIQRDVEVKGPTGGQLPGGEKPIGPLMLQGDHGIVAYRNIWYRPAPMR